MVCINSSCFLYKYAFSHSKLFQYYIFFFFSNIWKQKMLVFEFRTFLDLHVSFALSLRLSKKKFFYCTLRKKHLFRQKLQIRPKKSGWSNHTVRGSGEGHCFQYHYIISTVEVIGISTITVISIPITMSVVPIVVRTTISHCSVRASFRATDYSNKTLKHLIALHI